MAYLRALLRGAGLAAVLAATAGCSPPPEPLRLGLIHWPGFEPLALADDLGYFGADSVRVLRYSSGAHLKGAFRNGAVDVAASSLMEALDLARLDPDVRVVLVLDHSNGADVLMGREELATPADLRGRTIGFEVHGAESYLVGRALELFDVELGEVRIVEVPINKQEKLFRSGAIDAAVTFEPFRSRLVDAGARPLFSSASIPNEILDVLVVRQAFMDRNPRAVEGVIEGWFRALDYMKHEPQDATRRLAGNLGLDISDIPSVYSELRLAGRDENREMLLGTDPRILTAARHSTAILEMFQVPDPGIDITRLPGPGPLARILDGNGP